jgi:hypothetical protein
VDLKRALATGAVLLLAGCEIYSVPAPIPCPGTRQGVLTFDGALMQPAGCPWASTQIQSTFSYPGSISYAEGSSNEAWLCVDAPHAVPRTGTHTGDYIDVAYRTPLAVGNCTCPTEDARAAGLCTCPPTSPLANCTCPVVLTERTAGILAQQPGGDHFSGTQVDQVDPPEGVVLPANACDCQVQCAYAYTVEAKPL